MGAGGAGLMVEPKMLPPNLFTKYSAGSRNKTVNTWFLNAICVVRYSMHIPVWKQAPFIRLLAPLIAGILLQWHFPAPVIHIKIIIGSLLLLLAAVSFMLKKKHLLLPQVSGFLLMLVVLFSGCWLVYRNDVRNNPFNISSLRQYNGIRAVINEPLLPRERSYKTTAKIISVYHGEEEMPATGTIFLYLKKDSLPPGIQPGNEIVFRKPLQPIKNNGNPGGMNYRRYCLFQGITHQVFLQEKEMLVTGNRRPSALDGLLWTVRDITLSVIKKYIPGTKEQGVAEALLIGYRNDMDRELAQAYSNTGAVHVIAISGMHLGLIYVLVLALFKPFERKRAVKWLKPVVVIFVLWLFTLVAGAAPSILRSAVMFTCMAVAGSMGRKTNIFNTLAASAFLLLCINPFSLWDVGFRLSYAAVLSIVIFMQPLYQLFSIKNKWADALWKLNAVTLSAQILTVPVVIFHFHQFPNLFLVANLVAVPLSGFILFAELILMAVSIIPPLAFFTGKITGYMIFTLNYFIEWCGSFSFAVTGQLQMNGWECICLFLIIILLSRWLFRRTAKTLLLALSSMVVFGLLRLYEKGERQLQRSLVVYHIPGQQAVDFIFGSSYWFKGDSAVRENGFLQNFHLDPSRILFNIKEKKAAPFAYRHPFYFFEGRTILLLDSGYRFLPGNDPLPVDVLVLSHNPRIYFTEQAKTFQIKQVVADGSNPAWKMKLWRADCDSLKIPFYETAEDGAFILDCRKPITRNLQQ